MNQSAHHKVKAYHLKRDAYLYVRQSTLRQVFENTESTRCLASSIRSLPVASSPNVTIELRLISRLILMLSGQRVSFSRCPAGERREP